MTYFGTTDLNPGVKVTETAVSMEYPDLPLTTMDRGASIDDLATYVGRAMRIYQEKFLKRAPETWVPLVTGYPSTTVKRTCNIKFTDIKTFDDYYFLFPFCNLVTYTLRFQAPAGSKKAFGVEKQRASVVREHMKAPESPGLAYSSEVRELDNLVQFDCWSSTGRGADQLASWFKECMEFMKGSIMLQGFQKILFWERGIDKDILKWREDVACRSLQYLVKTEEHYIVPRRILSSIDIEMRTGTDSTGEQNIYLQKLFPDPSGLTSGIDSATLIKNSNSLTSVSVLEH